MGQAYEVAGSTTVPVDGSAIVRMWLAADGTHFSFQSSALTLSANTWTNTQTIDVTDAGTTTVIKPLVIGHDSSGTPAAGFGVGLKFTLGSTTTVARDAALIETLWTTATDATRTAALVFLTVTSAAALAEGARLAGSAFTVGVAGTSTGKVAFSGATSGVVTVQPAAAAGTWTMTLPTGVGTSGYVLQTDGAGVTSWVAQSGGSASTIQLFKWISDQSNGTTVETDLNTATTAANQLATDGEQLYFHFHGYFNDDGAATKHLRVYFAGTKIFDSGAVVVSAVTQWTLSGWIMRTDSSNVAYSVELAYNGADPVVSVDRLAVTFSGTNILKTTGQSTAGGGTGSAQVVSQFGSIEWKSS